MTFTALILGLAAASAYAAGQSDDKLIPIPAEASTAESTAVSTADDAVELVEESAKIEPAEQATKPADWKFADSSRDAPSSAKPMIAKLIDTIVPASDGIKLASCERCGHQCTDCCCPEWTIFGEWLLLQPRNGDFPYADRARTCFGPPIGTEQIDFGSFSGFKVGLGRSLDECHAITGSFTFFEANEDERVFNRPGVDILRPRLSFDPFATCDDATSTRARASAGIDFRRADVDYQTFIDHGCCRFDWLAGFAYGQLNQDIRAVYDTGRVNVESDAWGYGVRFGGGAQCGKGCIRGFSHVDLTLLASNLKANFREIDDTATIVARVDRDLDRIIPVLDIELGLAMDLHKNTVLKFGYVYSIWFNVVTAPEFVESVQGGDLSGPSGTLTFDGIFARLEYMW